MPLFNRAAEQSASRPQPPAQMTQLGESLHIIKQEYDTIAQTLESVCNQRDVYQSKVTSQTVELNEFRRHLRDLEERHHKLRQKYEDELKHLRTEILIARRPINPPRLPNSLVRVPESRSHPNEIGEGAYTQNKSDTNTQNRGTIGKENEAYSRAGGEDREVDSREPKRVKSERRNYDREDGGDGSGGGDLRSPPVLQQSPPISLSQGRGTLTLPGVFPLIGTSSSRQTGLSAGRTGSESALGKGLDPATIPPEFRKDGHQWFVLYNPAVKRALDINLLHTLTHESVVCCVQFSADGRYLATGCNRTAQIYDAKTGAKICVLADDAESTTGDLYIRSVRFSPDGKLLATGAEDRHIRIWDIAQRKIRTIFKGHREEIYSLDFSKDGRTIISGSGDKTARIWDLVTGSCKTLVITDSESVDTEPGVTSVSISPNGLLLAAGSLDSVVRIWEVSTGVLVERLRGHGDSVYSVAFTPNGDGLVSGSLDKTIKYWDVSGIAAAALARSHPKSDSASSSPLVKKEVEVRSSQATLDFIGHKDYVLSVAVSLDGKWVVSGSKDRGVQFWDPETATLQCLLQGHRNSVISLDLSPIGGMLATGSGDSISRIWQYHAI